MRHGEPGLALSSDDDMPLATPVSGKMLARAPASAGLAASSDSEDEMPLIALVKQQGQQQQKHRTQEGAGGQRRGGRACGGSSSRAAPPRREQERQGPSLRSSMQPEATGLPANVPLVAAARPSPAPVDIPSSCESEDDVPLATLGRHQRSRHARQQEEQDKGQSRRARQQCQQGQQEGISTITWASGAGAGARTKAQLLQEGQDRVELLVESSEGKALMVVTAKPHTKVLQGLQVPACLSNS
jgi:hypothetical protein